MHYFTIAYDILKRFICIWNCAWYSTYNLASLVIMGFSYQSLLHGHVRLVKKHFDYIIYFSCDCVFCNSLVWPFYIVPEPLTTTVAIPIEGNNEGGKFSQNHVTLVMWHHMISEIWDIQWYKGECAVTEEPHSENIPKFWQIVARPNQESWWW